MTGSGRGTEGRRRRIGVAVALAAVAVLAIAGPASAAPGVPAPPTVVFEENFENVDDPVLAQFLNTYTGPAPLAMTYTADSTWIDAPLCNGTIASWNSTPNATCASGTFNSFVRPIVLGLGGGAGVGEDNQAMGDVTAGVGSAATPAATMQTVGQIPLPSTNRFITFSVDVGVVSCSAPDDPLLRWFLLDGPSEIPATNAAVNPCTDPRGAAVGSVRVGTYPSDSSILVSASQIGLKLTNDQTGGSGNDYAIDNVRMLDASPQLDKAFGAAQATVGDRVRLTFTITNTTDLAQKPGWSFTDTLPAGMSVAAGPNVATTCTNGAVSPAGQTITVVGDLDTGQASCTASVDVVLTRAGNLSNGAANVKTTGLNPPGPPATITSKKPKLKTTQTISKRKLKPGQKTTLRPKVTNTSNATLRKVKVCQKLPPGLSFAGGKPKLKKQGGKYCHTFKSLDPGESASLRIKARAAAGSCGPLNARATGTSSNAAGSSVRERLQISCPLVAGGVTG